MQSRLFALLVALLWLCTMGWLVSKKVLPSLLSGSPPGYESTLPPEDKRDEPESWRVWWNGAPVGLSTSHVTKGPSGTTKIASKLEVHDLPLSEVLPGGVARLLGSLTRNLDQLDFEVTNDVHLDELGGLSSFETTARLQGSVQQIRVSGVVSDGRLKLKVRSGDITHELERALPEGALVSNEFAPYAYLRDLRIGQTWTVPVYSPFNAPTAPMEMIQASVDRQTTIEWNGEPVRTLLVVFRNQASLAATSDDDVVGQMWVRRDGAVLRQQVELLGKKLTFERIPYEEAAVLEL
jgi:hypothetical protein